MIKVKIKVLFKRSVAFFYFYRTYVSTGNIYIIVGAIRGCVRVFDKPTQDLRRFVDDVVVSVLDVYLVETIRG